jgi:hypothetical protein
MGGMNYIADATQVVYLLLGATLIAVVIKVFFLERRKP